MLKSRSSRRKSPATIDLLGDTELAHLQNGGLASADDAVVITDHKGTIIWVNAAFTTLTGYTQKDAIGKNPGDLTKSGAIEREIYQDLWETILAGRVWRGELIHRRKDGSHYPEEQTVAPIHNALGKITHVIAIKRDITLAKSDERKLVASEIRYRRLFESAKDGILILDAYSGAVVDVNPYLVQLLGISFEDFIGKKIWELGFFDDIVANRESFLQLQRNGYIRFEDKPLKASDGRQIDVEFVCNVYLANNKKVIQCNVRDITERKKAEASHARLVAILECTTDLVSISDPSGQLLYLNHSGRNLLGVAPGEDITKTSLSDFIPDPASSRIVTEGIPAAVLQGSWSGETALLSRGGREIPVSQVILAHKTPAGSIDFLSMVMRDITERNQSEVARRQMAAIVDSSDDAIISKDLDGIVTSWNKGAERIFGFTAHDIVGSSIMRIIPGDRKEEEEAILEKIRHSENIEHFETIRITKDRRMIHVSLTASPIKDGAGKIIGVSKVARDITARLILEDQYRQTQKMEAIGTLAGGIAHDFNNILSAIVGYTELAQIDLEGNPKVRRYLGGTIKATKRATALVRQILTFSRQQPQNRVSLQLGPIISECASLLRATVPTTIEFELSFASDAPAVFADANQVHQVIMNLGTNAWYAMKDRTGRLELRLERFVADDAFAAAHAGLGSGVYARISVGDTGCGMNRATLRRVFEPFFTTKPLGEGTGLGLSVVHGIMQSHEGAVTVYSHPGEGTVFHLYFPAYGGVANAAAIGESAVPRGHGERILFVDDEELLSTLGRKMLTALGYKVEAMTQPAAAIAAVLARPQRYSLVLSDQFMPGSTGIDLASQLQQIRPGLPIILMSGYAASLTPERISAAGVRQLLLKPITMHALGTAVFEALSAKPLTRLPWSGGLSPREAGN